MPRKRREGGELLEVMRRCWHRGNAGTTINGFAGNSELAHSARLRPFSARAAITNLRDALDGTNDGKSRGHHRDHDPGFVVVTIGGAHDRHGCHGLGFRLTRLAGAVSAISAGCTMRSREERRFVSFRLVSATSEVCAERSRVADLAEFAVFLVAAAGEGGSFRMTSCDCGAASRSEDFATSVFFFAGGEVFAWTGRS